ncbi:hypothetical protein ONZ45_g10298 [Pleurotus djamor]|nr:hypothetical protein ONZ45_g10298 [Pleurotus djamor]
MASYPNGQSNHSGAGIHHHYAGDSFTGNQYGGNVGGQNNTNSIFNEGNLRTMIQSIASKSQLPMDVSQVKASLKEIEFVKKECQELYQLANEHEALLKQKLAHAGYGGGVSQGRTRGGGY